ncbi:hypothetical protein ACO0RG_001991 [Hanseniaspora osmophila]
MTLAKASTRLNSRSTTKIKNFEKRHIQKVAPDEAMLNKPNFFSLETLTSSYSFLPIQTPVPNENEKHGNFSGNSSVLSTATTKTDRKFCYHLGKKSFALSVCGLIYGWEIGTVGGIMSMPSFRQDFTRLAPINIGMMISGFYIGCCIGGLFLSILSTPCNFEKCIAIGLAIYLVGILLEFVDIGVASSFRWIQFMVARVIVGLSVGCNSVMAPILMIEISSVHAKSFVALFYHVMCTFGILLGSCCNAYCIYFIEGAMQWKVPIVLGLLYSNALLLALCLMAPESPTQFIQGLLTPRKDTGFIMRSLHEKSKSNVAFRMPQWHDFITGKPKLGVRLLIGCLIMIFQQCCGINYFFYYSTMIFPLSNPYLISALLTLLNFLASGAAMLIPKKFSHRTLLVAGSLGCCLAMFTYATIGTFVQSSAKTVSIVIVTCVFIVFFASSVGPVSFAVVNDLFPQSVKNTSLAVCSITNWTCAYLIALIAPSMSARYGFSYGYLFFGFTLVSVIFYYFAVPETKNKTSNEIDQIYL